MDMKRFVLASLAGGLILLATGFLFYAVLLRDFMEANSAPGLMKAQPDMALLSLGALLLGAFLTLILSRWPGIGNFADGAKAGAMLGLLLGLGLNLALYATMNIMEAVTLPVHTIVAVARVSLASGAIGAVLGRG